MMETCPMRELLDFETISVVGGKKPIGKGKPTSSPGGDNPEPQAESGGGTGGGTPNPAPYEPFPSPLPPGWVRECRQERSADGRTTVTKCVSYRL
jgi:hypothetical protein